MQSNVVTEKQYSINFYRLGTKDNYGVNVTVTGDRKAKVMKEAKEMLSQAIKDADAIQKGEA